MRIQSHFNTALLLISFYDGNIPLAHFLKQYFSQHKKHGSQDRKSIAHLCYCYYRLGHVLKDLDTAERLKIALFLCNENAGDLSILFHQDWIANWDISLSQRIAFIQTNYPSFLPQNIFPFIDELSQTVDGDSFAISHLIQPDLFLRVRPGKEQIVLDKLTKAGVSFQQMSASCLRLPNASKIEAVLKLNAEAVIQDLSSQAIAGFIPQSTIFNPQLVWDCCAASGGKSILIYDMVKNISLTVSDIRPSIIHNLRQRFREAGIKNYTSFVADLTETNKPTASKFDLIVCDAPCSGSGTWARTPEQLYFFRENRIAEYAALQQKIAGNVIPHLGAGGYFLYITCSVFEKENEGAVEFIERAFGLEMVKKGVIKGYELKADTMFAALFRSR
jgi:16S rRNA (cytosine967-C5)-methyltransferase